MRREEGLLKLGLSEVESTRVGEDVRVLLAHTKAQGKVKESSSKKRDGVQASNYLS